MESMESKFADSVILFSILMASFLMDLDPRFTLSIGIGILVLFRLNDLNESLKRLRKESYAKSIEEKKD